MGTPLLRTSLKILLVCFVLLNSCKEKTNSAPVKEIKPEAIQVNVVQELPKGAEVPKGMVWIPGGEFVQGGVPGDQYAMQHEKPAHKVAVDGFFMDIHEVTNSQFSEFVQATGYVTIAEREIDWEEMKKQLPEGTPKPHDSIMQPGSLVFKKTKTAVPNLYDFSQWWKWTIGASWKHPDGPGSSIKGKEQHPVVHIAYDDAKAYCEWAGRRLPTEAEWEYAARAGQQGPYFWGTDESTLDQMANTWNGQFPVSNSGLDGYERRAPVKTFPSNGFGLYDMSGNVWEWTSDWYNTNYYGELGKQNITVNPKGAATAFNSSDPYAKEKVMKGGSFLCNASYCASYRISSRMASSLDSSLEHLGFRTVASLEMIGESE